MLRGLRSRVARAFARSAPATPEQAERAAGKARHERAGTIGDLRGEIRRLQQDIQDVSAAQGGAPTEAARAGDEGRLAALHDQLDRKQRELARLQARV